MMVTSNTERETKSSRDISGYCI